MVSEFQLIRNDSEYNLIFDSALLLRNSENESEVVDRV